MTPDDMFEDTLGDDEDLMADADFYPDSGSDYLDDEDEADYSGGSKRREQTRRASLRRDTSKVKAWAGRGMARSRRRLDKRALSNLARRHWRQKVQPNIFPASWERIIGLPLPPGFVAVLGNLYVQTAISLASHKLADATSPTDALLISGRAALASAIMRSRHLRGKVSSKQAHAYATEVFNSLEPAEQILKIVIDKAGSGEAEIWDDEDQFDGYDGLDEDEDFSDAMVRRASASPAERVRCANALRNGARYLLRLERQLAAGGR